MCNCNGVPSEQGQHCLNSQGPWDVGAKEGFAQFYGDKLYNFDTEPNATFVYYKPFPNSTTPGDDAPPPVAKDGFGDYYNNPGPDLRWNMKKCGGGYNGTSVEYDWMRFYYNIGSQDSGRAATRTQMLDLFAIYKLACGTQCTPSNYTNVAFNSLNSAAESYYNGGPGDARYQRFNTWGFNEGINE